MQFQATQALALNFRFVLVLDNSRIEVQFRNTILSLRLCTAPAHD